MDGIEIPNINHFATQGATGGSVSIVNADLVREISFYTGAFPADRAGGVEPVLDFKPATAMPSGRPSRRRSAPRMRGISGSGHIGEKTTYLFLAQTVPPATALQDAGAPLPAELHRRTGEGQDALERDELTFLALAGIDNMKLNVDEEGEDAEYMLSYLPRIQQETFTVGALVAPLCRAACADRNAEPQLPEQPQPQVPRQRRLVGGEPHAAAALRRAEEHAAGREPHLSGTVDPARRGRAELFELYEPLPSSASIPTRTARRTTAPIWASSAGGLLSVPTTPR